MIPKTPGTTRKTRMDIVFALVFIMYIPVFRYNTELREKLRQEGVDPVALFPYVPEPSPADVRWGW